MAGRRRATLSRQTLVEAELKRRKSRFKQSTRNASGAVGTSSTHSTHGGLVDVQRSAGNRVARSLARARQTAADVVQRYKCKKCGKDTNFGHKSTCPDYQAPVVAGGFVQGTHYEPSSADGKGAVKAFYGGSEFVGSGRGCAEPQLLQTYATKPNGKKRKNISLAWSQNTLPCHKCDGLLKESSSKYGNTYTVKVENNLGKPYGYAHTMGGMQLPDNADTTITYAGGAASYATN